MMTKTMTKLLPYSQEAEQCVLGAVLNDSQAVYTALSLLEAEDFYSKRHGVIFQAFAELSRKETPIDFLSLAEFLRSKGTLEEIGGLSYLTELEQVVPTSQAITHHSQIVGEKAALRHLVKVGDKITRQAWDEEDDPKTLIESTQNEIYNIGLNLENKGRGKQVFGPQEIAQLAAESAANWLEDPNKARGIQTGYARLDSILNGLKDVNIISASTGIGKTAFALNLASRIAINQKIPTLYLNHEMNLEELTVRLQGIISGVPPRNILNGKYSAEDSFQKVMMASEKIRDGRLFMTDNQPKTINTVIGMIRKHKALHDVKLVILDYLGEIEPTRDELRESEYVIYGQWVQRLKAVCTTLGCKLILLAQLNREGDREVSKNKIGGSWKIAQKADTFLILGVNNNERHFLKIDKNRNGPAPKTIELNFDKETQRIYEMSDEKLELTGNGF